MICARAPFPEIRNGNVTGTLSPEALSSLLCLRPQFAVNECRVVLFFLHVSNNKGMNGLLESLFSTGSSKIMSRPTFPNCRNAFKGYSKRIPPGYTTDFDSIFGNNPVEPVPSPQLSSNLRPVCIALRRGTLGCIFNPRCVNP